MVKKYLFLVKYFVSCCDFVWVDFCSFTSFSVRGLADVPKYTTHSGGIQVFLSVSYLSASMMKRFELEQHEPFTKNFSDNTF